jgi:hypothetical protein
MGRRQSRQARTLRCGDRPRLDRTDHARRERAFSGEMRVFRESEITEARAWVREE